MKKLALCLAITSALGLTACDDTTLDDVNESTSDLRTQQTQLGNDAQDPRVMVVFDPGNSLLSIPNDLLFSGTSDFTLEMPDEVAAKMADQDVDWGNPSAVLGALDGWGTQNSFVIELEYEEGAPELNAASVASGDAVAMYEVITFPELSVEACSDSSLAGLMCQGVDKLTFGVDYFTSVVGGNIVVTPLKPLPAGKTFAVALTKEIVDANGNALSPSSTYGALEAPIATHPLVDPNKTDLTETEAGIQTLQVMVNNFESTLARDFSADAGAIVYTQVFTTQSAGVPGTDPLQVTKLVNAQAFAAMAAADPASVLTPFASQGMNVAQAFAAQGLIENDPMDETYLLLSSADIYGAQIQVPYYLENAEGSPLSGRWEAACSSGVALATLSAEQLGALAPTAGTNQELCAGLGLADFPGVDTERHLTKYNPLPKTKSMETVDVQITIPNIDAANIVRSAQRLPALTGKPEAGWPVVILQHGITSQKENMLSVTGFLSMFGFATVAIDHPLHGSRGFTISGGEGQPDVVVNATTNQATDYLNLSSLLTARDNLRQSTADGLKLRLALNAMGDFTNPTAPDLAPFDTSKVYYLGHSLGAITGTSLAAVANTPVTVADDATNAQIEALYKINAVMLANPGGSIANFLTQSAAFGPLVNASVVAGLGTDASATLLSFLTAEQYPALVAANPACGAALNEEFEIVDQSVALVCAYNAFLASAPAEQLAEAQAGVAQFAFAAQAAIEAGDPTNYASLLAATQTPVLMIEMVGDGAQNLPDQVIPNSVPGNLMAGTSGLAASIGLPQITEATFNSTGTVSGLVKFRYGSHSTMLTPSTSLPAPYDTVFENVYKQLNTMMAYFFITDGSSINIDEGILNACVIKDGGPEACESTGE